MSSRVAEKENRKAERIQGERGLAQRRRRRQLLAGGGFGVLAVGVVAATFLLASGSQRSSTPNAKDPFGTHYAGLAARRENAHVPTMMQTMGSGFHLHPRISVLVDGKQMPVPANIGIDPAKDPMQMAGLHTHDSAGTIHVEGARDATLGQFFAIWGVPMSATQLGPYRLQGTRRMHMWVNGKPSTAFGSLRLADGQRIVVSFGSASSPARS